MLIDPCGVALRESIAGLVRSQAAIPVVATGHPPLARRTRYRHQRRACHLRQQPVAHFRKARNGAGLVRQQIPFVDSEDDGAALARHQVGDGQVLLLERRQGVDHHDDAVGEADGRKRGGDTHLLQRLARHARFLAQAGGIVQQHFAVFYPPGRGDGVAGQARFRPGEGAFLTQKLVEEAGLADIGPSHQRQAQRLVAIVVILFFHRRVFVLVGRRFGARDMLLQRLGQFAHAQPMFGGQADRLAKAQAIDIVQWLGSPFAFVGQQDHRLA